jgi:transcriptional regulator with XRE-family HTH domain
MSSSLSIDARRRTYVRLIGEIRHALNQALTEEHTARGLTKADIARLLGKDKSFVSKKLAGTSNMTLETLADLAFAMNRPAHVSLPSRSAAKGVNSVLTDTTKSETSPPIRRGDHAFSGMAT